jgi:hypothetical protein
MADVEVKVEAKSPSKAIGSTKSPGKSKSPGEPASEKSPSLTRIPSSKVEMPNRVPVIAKGNVWTKKVLLCQSDDKLLNFDGDSGAIGRITSNEDSLHFDLKGRQYEGKIVGGPTVMLLNLAPPVGQQNYKEVARAEVLTSEFCHLHFAKDVLGSIMGEFTGNISRHGYDEADAESETDKKPDASSAEKKMKKKTASNPTISNVTNRKRKAGAKGKTTTARKGAKRK